jgi:lysophospholipase L1-like esterase
MLEIVDAIRNGDLLLLSCGANDILASIKKVGLTSEDIYDSFTSLYDKTRRLIAKIKAINSNIIIIFIGLYFPYPHSKVLKKFDHMKELDLHYEKLVKKYKNLYMVSVYQEILDNKDKYMPSKRNIHLNEEGYEMIFNKIVKLVQSIKVGTY